MDDITLEAVIDLLSEIKDDIDFETQTNLIDARLLDSFDILAIVSAVDDEFDVAIPAREITPANFNSAQAICTMVQRLSEDS